MASQSTALVDAKWLWGW